jgi:hypothetical protein
MYITVKEFPLQQRTRLIDSEIIMNVQTLLKTETWESVYLNKDSNLMFSSFLCTFLIIFQAIFPVKCKSMKRQQWLYYARNKKILQTKKEVCMPSLRTAEIQKQKRVTLSIIKS